MQTQEKHSQAAVLGLQHLLAMYWIYPGSHHDCDSPWLFS